MTQKTILISTLTLTFAVLLLLSSCKKDESNNVPSVSTASITEITTTTAISGGEITGDGGATITARGVCWGTSQNPTISGSKTADGTGTSSFTSNITGLAPNTTYYVRAYATNSEGTSYGNEVNFKTENNTSINIPTLTTTAVTEIGSQTATSGGTITDDGGAAISARGVCWGTSQNPTISGSKTDDGTGSGSFTSSISGLEPNTTYYVRAYATNSKGTSYGNEVNFKTSAPDGTTGTLTYNSYTYKTVYINGKEWLAENLLTTAYNDGTAIPNVTEKAAWAGLSTGAYCWHSNDINNKSTYGALYNWHAVNSGKLAPTGWHVPTDAEWTALTDYLGGLDVAGGKLKETGTTHWNSTNNGATNETGFTALPGGSRSHTGAFFSIGEHGDWWSTTEFDTQNAWIRRLSYNYRNVQRYSYSKGYGYSVRCVRD